MKSREASAIVIGVLLAIDLAWWLAGAGASLYSPYARSADDLDIAAVVSLGVSAAVLCPLLGWIGWRIGLRLGGGRRAPTH